MALPIDLVLVRHGESEGNVANRRSRRGNDSAFTEEFLRRHSSTWRLTERGRDQAAATGGWISRNIAERFERYYVSEYIRAMETAALLGLPDAQWYRDFNLRERDWGELDVMADGERKRRFAQELQRRRSDTFFWCPPNGESLAQLCLRVDRILFTLHRECADGRVIAVCHGEVMWAFRVRLERMSQTRFRELDRSRDPHDRIHNGQVLHYTRRDPDTGEVSPHADWVRSVLPEDPSLSRNAWERIVRPRFSNEELLREVELVVPTVK